MIDLRSCIDGFRVILGGYIIHLAAFLALVCTIRTPPEYTDDPTKTENARTIFISLAVLHSILFVVRFYGSDIGRQLWSTEIV